MQTFNLNAETIELVKLLKLLGIAESGGQAKRLVDDGEVLLNGNPEFRKRAKLKAGDVIEVMGERLLIR